MTDVVEIPIWQLVLLLVFAAVTFASHFLFPSVRWFLRRRMERVVARLNTRLERPIQDFKLTRRTDMIQRLLYDPEVMKAVVEHAQQEGVREDVAFQLARRYAREIVPSFSASLYFGFAIRAARWISNALYRVRLGHHAEDALKAVDPEASIIFVMNHRSNMDYVLVTYLAAERSALSYAVGEWARIWPVSRLIRALGGYFIRRKSRNALYRRVLARYVALATQGGVAQAMFPEGGLSLNGALSEPKVGLLKYILDAQQGAERDVVFVPVAINYDRVLEDRILVAAAASGQRRFRTGIFSVISFWSKQIWLRVTGQFHRFGYAAVSFGAPLPLSQLPDNPETLARELIEKIGAVVPVLPVPAIAHILRAQAGLTRPEIEQCFAALLDTLPNAHIHIPRQDVAYATEVGLRALVERGAIQLKEDRYLPVEEEGELLAFYANSIAHLVPAAAIAK